VFSRINLRVRESADAYLSYAGRTVRVRVLTVQGWCNAERKDSRYTIRLGVVRTEDRGVTRILRMMKARCCRVFVLYAVLGPLGVGVASA